MPSVNAGGRLPLSHEIEFRVRYQETDAQGRVHHSNYANWFEMGRTELVRSSGISYKDIEAAGVMLVVTDLRCQFILGAQYDDLIRLKTTVVKARGVRIINHYEVYTADTLLAKGETTVAAVNPAGKVVRLPDFLVVH
jgi:acyl-CoA thioester hydrolase